MTHEEYVARVETFTDSPEDVAAVLAHSNSCAMCKREERVAEKTLAELDSNPKSPAEAIVRWSAVAAILVLVVLGFQKEPRSDAVSGTSAPKGRYLIVGNASGVVAYTPEGIVVGVPPRTSLQRGR